MIKRLAIAVTTAAAFLFSFSVGHQVTAPQPSTSVTSSVTTTSCPSPLVEAPDGTCWP